MTAPGALVEFYQDKKILGGFCVKADKKSLHLISEENREVGIPPQRVLLSTTGFLPPAALRDDVVAKLRKAVAAREAVRESIAVADLWDLLCDEPGQYKVEELAATWFSGELGAEQISGMLRALYDDRVYFERKNELYIANSRERVAQLLESIQAEQNKIVEREAMGAWLQRIWAQRAGAPSSVGMGAGPDPDCLPKYLEWIKDVALLGPESSRFKEIQTVMTRAGIQQRNAALQVLVKAGVWAPHENLALHRNKVPIRFSNDLLEAAHALVDTFASGAWKGSHRVDLSDLDAVTIDDVHTVETDDAVSVRKVEAGWEVGVHIADPAEFVEKGSAIDREALHRGTSIYFPDQKIPMLPPVLGTGICSLEAGQERPALSIMTVLDDEANVLETRIVESTVRVARRLTYDDVDAALVEETDASLTRLHALSTALRARRLAGGAVFVPFPSVEVRVDVAPGEEPRIEVLREERDSPSQVLVSEFMILANHAVARYLVANGIPALFRGQPPPSEPVVFGDTFTPLDGFRVRRFLKKSETSLDPIHHSGLGLDAYVQFTSPIRRYLDLVLHRQVKAHLREGSPVYTRQEVEQISFVTSTCAEQADAMERSRKAYWIYRLLEERVWREQRAVVLQTFPDRYHVQLIDTLVETDCPNVPGVPVSPGDVIDVKIDMVFPREGVVRVSALLAAGR